MSGKPMFSRREVRELQESQEIYGEWLDQIVKSFPVEVQTSGETLVTARMIGELAKCRPEVLAIALSVAVKRLSDAKGAGS